MKSRPPPGIRRAFVYLTLLLACGLSQADLRSAARAGARIFAPTVAATLTDSLLTDGDGDGKADPGDTIRYTTTIAVSGEDATGVEFSATIDAGTTLVPDSVVVSPKALAETYQTVGNMTLATASIAADCTNPLRSVVCNDLGASLSLSFGNFQVTANGTVANGSNSVTTTNNGLVTLTATGTFNYVPAPGFEGTDTFWYTLTNPAGSDNAQVSIVVGGVNGMAWFVTSAGAGTGRQNNPISLEGLRAINNGTGDNPNDGDTIFLLEGNAHALTSPITLRASQKLIGQDATTTVATLGGASPQPGNSYPADDTGIVSITSQAHAIQLGSSNTLAGFTVGTTTTFNAVAITGSAAGTIQVRDVVINSAGMALVITTSATFTTTAPFTGFTSVSSTGGANSVSLTGASGTLALGGGALSGTDGVTFNVNGGDANITYAGTISHNAGTRMISVSNTAGGSVTFSTATANGLTDGSSSMGILIDGAAGNVTVNNASLNGQRGIVILGDAAHNATGSYTFNNVAIDTTTGPAFWVDGDQSAANDNDVSAVVDLNNVDILNPGSFVATIAGMNGGSIDFDAASTIVRTNGGAGIVIDSNAAGTITFNGTTKTLNTFNNPAVQLSDNGAAITFAGGGLDINTTNGAGFTATNNASITVQGAGNTISSGANKALDISSSVIGAGGLTFDDVTSSGGYNGIKLAGVNGGAIALGTGSLSATEIAFLVGEGNGSASGGGTAAITYDGTIAAAGDQRSVVIEGRPLGAGNITLSGTITQVNGSFGVISIADSLAGTITFSGANSVLRSSPLPAVSLTDNPGAVINFTGGGLDIFTVTGTGFLATGGGTINVTGSGNKIEAVNGTALHVSNTTIGASDLTFMRISAGSSATGNGITLDTTGSFGGLHVIGDGTTVGASGGGVIRLKTGVDGSTANGNCIYLNDTAEVSLNGMLLAQSSNHGIFGFSVNGFKLTNSAFQTIGTTAASNDAPIAFGTSGANGFATGATAEINNVNITASIEHGIEVYQQSGTFDLTISDSNIHDNTEDGSDGLVIGISGSANARIKVNNTLFDENGAGAVRANALGGLLELILDENTVSRTAQGGEGFVLLNGSSGKLVVAVTNNVFTAIKGANIKVGNVAGNATSAAELDATIANNTMNVGLGNIATTLSVLASSSAGQSPTSRILIDNNTIHTATWQVVTPIADPLFVSTPDANTSPLVHATVTNNSVNITDTFGTALRGITVESTQATSVMHADVTGNDVNYGPSSPPGVNGIRVRQVSPATLDLEPGSGGVLAANNPLSTTEIVGTVTVSANDDTAILPSLPTAPSLPTFMTSAAGRIDAVLAGVNPTPARHVATTIADRAAEPLGREANLRAPTRLPVAARGSAFAPWHLPAPLARWMSSQLRSAVATTLAVVRRVPDLLSATLEARSGETVSQNLGTISAGETVTIVFTVTVGSARQLQFSTQGTVSGSNFSSVLTDDTALGGPSDATITPGDLLNTTTSLEATPASPALVSKPVTLTATVTPEAGGETPTGPVTFKESGSNIAGCLNVSLNGSGVATCTIAGNTFSAGAKSFTAEYDGSGQHDPSVNAPALSYTYDLCLSNPVVSNLNDAGDGSLRDAIANVCAGDTITFDGAVTGMLRPTSGTLVLARNVTIDGPHADLLRVLPDLTFQSVFTVNSGVTATIRDIGIALGGSSDDPGGGINNQGGVLTVERVRINSNQASFGGAIANSNGGTVIVRDSTLDGNTALQNGGAIANLAGTVTIINSTISSNASYNDGAGLYQAASGAMVIINATITANTSDWGSDDTGVGGGIAVASGGSAAPLMTNTIVAGNFMHAGADRSDIHGAIDAGSSSNLIGDGTNMSGITHGANRNMVGSSAVPINAQLGDLDFNGGSIPSHQLLVGSPALDAGAGVIDPTTLAALTTDQRGLSRPIDHTDVVDAPGGNGSDIGALEVPGTPSAPDLLASSDTGASSTDNITSDSTPTFTIAGLTIGAEILMWEGATVVAQGTAAAGSVSVTIPTPLAEGSHTFSVIQRLNFSPSNHSPTVTVVIDIAAPATPTINLTDASDSGTSNSDNLTNATTRVFDIGSTETGAVVQLRRDASSVTSATSSGGTVQLSDDTSFTSGQAYAYTARQSDVAGNVSADSTTVNVTIDNTSPSVLMTSAAANPTNTSPIPVTVTFSKSVTGFAAGDIAVTNGAATNFAGSGAAYTFDLTPSGDGAITVDIAADAAVDAAGNTNTAATQLSRTYDATAPTVAITDVTPDPRNSAVSTVAIVFSEAVSGVTISDVTVTRNGGSNLLTGSQTLTTGNNITWTLGNLTGLTGLQGTYTLTLTAASSGIIDTAGNALTANDTDSWATDNTAPTVTINQAADQDDPIINGAPVTFTVVFSKPINLSTFGPSDIDSSDGDAFGSRTISEIAPNNGTTFAVSFDGTTPGNLTVKILAGTVADLVGNLNAASTSIDNTVTIDACMPAVTVTTTANSGPGSLRDALVRVCSDPLSEIDFNIAGPGPHTITLASPLVIDKIATVLGPETESVILDGGGISQLVVVESPGNAYFSGLTFANGNGAGLGSAIVNNYVLTLVNSLLTSNVSQFLGGAVTNRAYLSVVSSTISGNNTGGSGAGIFNDAAGNLFLLNATITNNQAGDLGGGLYNLAGLNPDTTAKVNLANSIIAGNTALNDGDNVFNGNGGVNQYLTQNLLEGDPMLGPLQNNGGPTFSHAPLPGSPAIDTGENAIVIDFLVTDDQRGSAFSRIRNGADDDTTQTVDLGAIEADPVVQNIPDLTMNEGETLGVTFRVGDTATAFGVFTVASSNTTLLPNNRLTLFENGPGVWTLVVMPVARQFGTSTITLTVRKTIAGTLVSMTDTFVVTVDPVANTPSITNATTSQNVQTTSGLVISRNVSDGAEVTHFKIVGLTGGTLFKNNGATPIALNAFITAAEGAAGLRFTPSPGSVETGHVSVRASVSNTDAGLSGGTDSASIIVTLPPGGFTDEPLIPGQTLIRVVHLVELRARVNALRVRFGLAPTDYTAPVAGSSMVMGQNLLQIRTALSEAYIAAGHGAPHFSDPGLPAGTLIKAVHIEQLRWFIRLLEAS